MNMEAVAPADGLADPTTIEEAVRNLLDQPFRVALELVGIPVDKAEEIITKMAERFPGGVIPKETLIRVLREQIFPSSKLYQLGEAAIVALGQRVATGRGAIQHSDANVA